MKKYDKKENNELNWLHHVRYTELKSIEEFLPSGKNLKILEIGGGDGFQAKILHDKGFSVVSVDMEPRIPAIFPVKKINSNNLDFSNESFDIVFTSHVLPHVQNLEETFTEIKRIVKKDGIVLHIVPTAGWSLITNIWHYLFIPKYILKSIKKRILNKSPIPLQQNVLIKNSTQSNIKKLFLHPLGQNHSFVHEIIFFSGKNWKKLFLKNGFKIKEVKQGPYITSGYGVLKFKLISFRKFFAKYFFSSSYCFILKL